MSAIFFHGYESVERSTFSGCVRLLSLNMCKVISPRVKGIFPWFSISEGLEQNFAEFECRHLHSGKTDKPEQLSSRFVSRLSYHFIRLARVVRRSTWQKCFKIIRSVLEKFDSSALEKLDQSLSLLLLLVVGADSVYLSERWKSLVQVHDSLINLVFASLVRHLCLFVDSHYYFIKKERFIRRMVNVH